MVGVAAKLEVAETYCFHEFVVLQNSNYLLITHYRLSHYIHQMVVSSL